MRLSIRPIVTAALLSLVFIAPAHAQIFGMSVPGIGGGGGGNFGATAQAYTVNVVTGMLNTVRGVENVQLALGKKQEAEKLEAIAKEIEAMRTTPDSNTIDRAATAIAADPVDRTALSNVKSAEGKKFVAAATANMMVATVYNAKAASSASSLAGMKPGISDISSAPALLDAVKATVTAGPTTIQNTATYLSALTDFMSTNKIPEPTKDQLRALAGQTDTNATANLP